MGSALFVLALFGAGWLLLRSSNSTPMGSKIIALDPFVGVGDDVWLLGDSLAVGIVKRLQALAFEDGVGFSSNARVGAATLWGSVQSRTPAARGHTVWLVCLGANDAAMSVPSPSFGKWVKSISDEALAHGAHVVWLVAPNGGGLPGYSRTFKTVMDIVPDVILPPSGLPFARDGVHLTPEGYSQWSEYVWKAVTSHREALPQS